MEEEECICAWGSPHYWDWCESCEEYDREIKCPVHYKEN